MTYKDVIWEPGDSIDGNNKLKTMIENDQYLNDELSLVPRGPIAMVHQNSGLSIGTGGLTLLNQSIYFPVSGRMHKFSFHYYLGGSGTAYGPMEMIYTIDAADINYSLGPYADESGSCSHVFTVNNITAGAHTIEVWAGTWSGTYTTIYGFNFLIEDIGQITSTAMTPT